MGYSTNNGKNLSTVYREYGETNVFENLVPIERTFHQTQFNPWWMGY